jgi:hypothetical protein
MHGKNEQFISKFRQCSVNAREHFVDISVDVSIILKQILVLIILKRAILLCIHTEFNGKMLSV